MKTKPKTQELVPKLRFPQFQSSGEWEIKRVCEFAKVTTGRKDTQNKVDGGVYPFFVRSQTIERINSFSYDGEAILTSGDGVGVGENFHYIDGKFDFHQRVYCIFNFKKNVRGKFLYLYFSEHFYKRVMQLSAKNSVDSVRMPMIADMPILLPNLDEQQKIADCLCSIDELINAQTQKLDVLKTYKKGLMQQLFPIENETIPKLRFPEFQDTGMWNEKKLEKLSAKIGDGIHATPLYDDHGEYYFINGNNLIRGGIEVDKKTKKVSENEYQKHKRDLNQNTILLSINGTIGNISVYNNEKVVLGKSACYININNKLSNKYFIMNFLKTAKTHNYFSSELTGSTIKNLSLKTVKNTKINLPPNIEEQQKIADCFSSIDKLITAQTQKIDTLKAHKKGLMQQLFPSIDEVTG